MKVLVVGGTQFVGVHLVRNLLAAGHQVSIATRGLRADSFGNRVDRIILDRTDQHRMHDALGGFVFDVVFDTQAHSSNEVKYLLDAVHAKRYVEVSTVSVYWPDLHEMLKESEFNPLIYPLHWCNRVDYPYDEIKRQAECALFQEYEAISSAAVRFPYIVGVDDYTKRLRFYVEHVVKSEPMYVDNLDSRLAFVKSTEAGDFLAWLADNKLAGPINAGSYGNISIREIIEYVENKVGYKSVLKEDGAPAPYNSAPGFSLDLSKTKDHGYTFSAVHSWMPSLLDALITEVKQCGLRQNPRDNRLPTQYRYATTAPD